MVSLPQRPSGGKLERGKCTAAQGWPLPEHSSVRPIRLLGAVQLAVKELGIGSAAVAARIAAAPAQRNAIAESNGTDTDK